MKIKFFSKISKRKKIILLILSICSIGILIAALLVSEKKQYNADTLQTDLSIKGIHLYGSNSTPTGTDARNAFHKYVYSISIPDQFNFIGVDGNISISSKTRVYYQALVSIMNSSIPPDGQCPTLNGDHFTSYDQIKTVYPGAHMISAFNIAANHPGSEETETVTTNTKVSFPVKVPITGCVFFVLDGGEPAYAEDPVTMTSNMILRYDTAPAPSPAPFFIPLAGEYYFGRDTGTNIANKIKLFTWEDTFVYNVALAMRNPYYPYLKLLSLTGNITTAAMTGRAYAPPPPSNWKTNYGYYLYQKCPPPDNGLHGPEDYYRVLPADATQLLDVTHNLTGLSSELTPISKNINSLLLKPGNCLINFVRAEEPNGNIDSRPLTQQNTNNPNGGMITDSQVWALVQPVPSGTLIGRVYIDSNGNSRRDSGEAFIKDPSASCASSTPLSGVNVSWAGQVSGSALVNRCNPDPYYTYPLPTGDYTVNLQLPSGWQSTSPNPVRISVTNNQYSNAWFGIRQTPTPPKSNPNPPTQTTPTPPKSNTTPTTNNPNSPSQITPADSSSKSTIKLVSVKVVNLDGKTRSLEEPNLVSKVINGKLPEVSEGEKLIISGTASPDAKIVAILESHIIDDKTQTDPSGNWTYTLDPSVLNLKVGDKKVSGRAIDAIGQTSETISFASFSYKSAGSISVLAILKKIGFFIIIFYITVGLVVLLAILINRLVKFIKKKKLLPPKSFSKF
ncbi:MAG: hypothetical protein Q7S37_03120 [bacterium]|nr:hypothetical protein [bacterium]